MIYMKILMENVEPEQETNVVNVDKEIDAIIKILSDTKRVIGDDEDRKRKLLAARMLLGNLFYDLQNENNDIVYFSGSSDDFMTKQERLNRRKTEEIHCVCDTLEELRTIMALLNSIGFQANEILSPLMECRKQLRKYVKKII